MTASQKILVIEDDDELRQPVVEVLELEGYTVLQASNGRDGIALARNKRPDLILCDIMMPQVDGYAVLEAIRENRETARTPFIFLTALADRKDIRDGMNLGAEDYLPKPVDIDDLRDTVNAQLSRSHARQEEELRDLNEVRSNIAGSLPHELLTPLNGILGMADLMLMDDVSHSEEELREIALSIKHSGERLERTVKRFLIFSDLCLIKSGLPKSRQRLTEATSPLCRGDLEFYIRRIARNWERERDLSVQFETIRHDPQIGDYHLILMMEQLLDNAFKFSEPGSPVGVLVKNLEDGTLCISVADKGRGLNQEEVGQIAAFTQFRRAHFEQQGTGLGLAIANLVADCYGGRIEIDSAPDEGSTFSFLLPPESP